MDEILSRILRDLTERDGCHTVILYGSRSRGDFTEESDYDLAGFRKSGEKLRDARVVEGKYIDAFVYPDILPAADLNSFLQLRSGTILLEETGFATALLASLQALFLAGPAKISPDVLHGHRVWIRKMLARAARGDLEGNFRRAWLQYEILEHYFQQRQQWYLGPKESFAWLRENDPKTLSAYERALAPGAGLQELKELAERVLG